MKNVTNKKSKKYTPTKFKSKTSIYDKDSADFAVNFIESLCHTKGKCWGENFMTYGKSKAFLKPPRAMLYTMDLLKVSLSNSA